MRDQVSNSNAFCPECHCAGHGVHYAGCSLSSVYQQTEARLTAADVRRIVREELRSLIPQEKSQ